jgi:flagellar assembly factor FliW
MTYDTTRFGSIEYDEAKAITFPEGLPGLEHTREYLLVHAEETEPIFWLQSLEDGDLALPVAYAFELKEDYALEVDDDDLAFLKIEQPDDVMVLFVVVVPDDITKMTANMAAPVLIQPQAGLGKQVFTKGSSYQVRQPIFDAVMAALERGEADAGIDA